MLAKELTDIKVTDLQREHKKSFLDQWGSFVRMGSSSKPSCSMMPWKQSERSFPAGIPMNGSSRRAATETAIGHDMSFCCGDESNSVSTGTES